MRRRALLVLAALALTPALARAAAKTDDKKKKAGGDSYIPIDTLTGSTNKPGGRRGVLSVECGLDIPDGNLRARANAALPRLRAAYVETILSYAAGLPNGAPPNAEFLEMTLQRQTDQVLGQRGARLLLGAILVN
jgi:hypothetical protein